MSNKNQTIEEFICSQLEEKFNEAQVFDKKLFSIWSSMEKIRTEVLEKKKQNPGLTYHDVKDQLTEFHRNHYYHQLYMEDYRKLAFKIIGIYPIAKLYKLLDTQDQEMVKIIEELVKKVNVSLFVVKNNEVVVFDEEQYQGTQLGIEQIVANEEALQNIFDSELFKVK